MRLRAVSLLLTLTAACSGDSNPPPPPPGLVYYGQVDRILADNCVECHSADPDRLAPFPLATYDDAAAAAETAPIAFAVMTRQMPPYYADDSGSCQSFTGNKWLTDDEIDTLVTWANGDRAAGDPADASPPPNPGPTLPRVDARFDLGLDYLPDATLDDDYRCFVVDPGVTAESFLTAFQVSPGNPTVVHHVIVYALPDPAAEAAAAALDDAAPGAGYPCVGGPTVAAASFLAGWVPGNRAVLFPADTGIRVRAGRKMIVQMHYNLAGSDGGTDRTAVEFTLADSVADEARIAPVRAPVNLPPGQLEVATVGSLTLPTAATGRLWGAVMHMHQRGVSGGLRLRGSSEACLLDLVTWNFHWQHFYWYAAPLPVRGGDRLEITCRYDTSDDTAPVTWGESTEDEMCISYVYLST